MISPVCIDKFSLFVSIAAWEKVNQGGHKPGKPGILRDFSEHGNSGNSVQPQGKIVTNKVFLVRHSNICVKQLLTWSECGGDLLYCWS